MLHSPLFWFLVEMVCVAVSLVSMAFDYADQSESHPITIIALVGAVVAWAGIIFLG